MRWRHLPRGGRVEDRRFEPKPHIFRYIDHTGAVDYTHHRADRGKPKEGMSALGIEASNRLAKIKRKKRKGS